MLLRAEGLASSAIEGLREPAGAVAAAQLDQDASGRAAAWVADNLAVVSDALAHAATAQALDVGEFHRWHARLMRHGDLDAALVGAFRDRQGWIGGRGPIDAAYVPPPAEHVAPLTDDLLAFANRGDVDAVTKAAVLHGQFETIHPYGDGNGRLGRLLVLWVLARDLRIAVPPATSVLIARDAGGYLAGLYWFRTGELARWVGWFADVVVAAAAATLDWAHEVDTVLASWRERLGDVRADAAAHAIAALLPSQPLLTAGAAAALVGVSDTAARAALEALANRGIVEPYNAAPVTRGRPQHWWAARDLIDLVSDWAR